MIKIYSHPRSGTNLLAAYLAKNFYSNVDTSVAPLRWGHWNDRRLKPEGNPYGKLIGSHRFPSSLQLPPEAIYISRQGEAVAYSLWKSEGFTNPDRQMTLKQYLRTPLDWWGSPSLKNNNSVTPPLHWLAHVEQGREKDLLHITYEELVIVPERTMIKIKEHFNLGWQGFVEVDELVGYSANAGTTDAWKKHFDEADKRLFND